MKVEPASYRFTDASGRFAVFDRAVVDLASERVAWAWNHDPSIVPVLAAKGQLLRRLFEGRQAVQLWSLLDGSYGPSFDGALVPHVAAPGRVALQGAEALDIVDTLSGSRVATLPAVGPIVSVLPVENGWRVLSRTGARRSQPGLVLVSTSGEPGSARQTLALELPPAPFSLLDTAEWHTDPFLSVDASDTISVNVIQRCVSCPDTEQLILWRSSIDAQSGRGERWDEALLDRDRQLDLVLPLFGPHVHQPPPPQVEWVLQGMRTTADPGLVLAMAPDASRMITGSDGRVCVWSTQPVERSWCEPRLYSGYQFSNSTHVWMSRKGARHEVAIWDLVRKHTSVRSFSPETTLLPGPDGWFLTYARDAQGRASDIEVWNLANALPQWTLQSCPGAPHFADGAYVVCPKATFDDEGALLLDLSSGREMSVTAPAGVAERCQFDVEPDVAALISRRGQPLATVFDLSASDWAIVLPDGRFHGSADAPTYLGFYGPDARPLGRDSVERLRQTSAVQSMLSQLQEALRGCPQE